MQPTISPILLVSKGNKMKIKKIYIFIALIIVSLLLFGCTANEQEVFPIEEDVSEPEVITPDELPEPEEAAFEEEEETPTVSRLTISAEEELVSPVRALYEAYFDGETPVFVDVDPDIIATASTPYTGGRPIIEATFLPGSVLVPVRESDDVSNFIDFSLSPEGQEILIGAGELPATITITDQAGNEIEFPQPVQRVISAFGPATSIVYSINAQNRLVAASFTGAGDPQGAAVMERIDPRFPNLVADDFFSRQNFNIEEAALLDPDLIIGSARSAWLDVVDQLGINVFLMDAETPQEIQDAVLLIGQIFGPHAYAQAQAWVDYFDFIISETSGALIDLSPDDRISVLFTGTEPLRVASGDMYQTDIIEAAGGISVSADLIGFWNDVNLEQIAIWDPDVIIVPPYGGASVEAITESSEWQILSAVQEGRVYRMPRLVAPWDTPGPDSVMGIVWLAEKLNPDIVSFSCGTEAVYFYNTFLNYAITGEEVATICVVD